MYGYHLLYSRVTWINRVKLRNLLVVSSTRKRSVLADASVVSTYMCTGAVLLVVFVYIPDTRYIFNLGTCTFVHGSLLYMYILQGLRTRGPGGPPSSVESARRCLCLN